jgi:uncharacterized protein (UPF0332 family)
MSFDWTEYLQLAQHLVGQDVTASDEAKRRTAISRAYYAVYNEARHFARQHDFRDEQYGNHRALIDYYLKESRREWKNVGVNLERLRNLRNTADYSARFERITYESLLALKFATSLLEQIDQLRRRFPPSHP